MPIPNLHPISPAQSTTGIIKLPTAPPVLPWSGGAPGPYETTATASGFPWMLLLLGGAAFGVVFYIRRRKRKKTG